MCWCVIEVLMGGQGGMGGGQCLCVIKGLMGGQGRDWGMLVCD